MKSSLSFAKVWFVVSFAGLAFLYGTAVGKWEWFPHSFLDRAVDQARFVFPSTGDSSSDDDGDGGLLTPRVYDREGVRQPHSESMHSGMTLVVSSWKQKDTGNLRPGARLIDEEGEVVHSWQPDREELFPSPMGFINTDPTQEDFHGSYLLPNGDLVVALTYIGAARIDACGDPVWRLEEGNHHSVARADDGSFWIPGVSSERKRETPKYPDGLPGLKKKVWMDRIIHVSEDGEVLDRINVLDVLYANDLEHYVPKGMGPYVQKIDDDPVHLNDIEPLSSSMAEEYPLFEAGDLMVSLRYPDLVFVFDPETKRVNWYESRHFTRQHDPDFIGDGWIGVFDNRRDPTERGEMLGGTRIVEIQPHTDSVRIPFPTQHSEPHYTESRGKWQKLENDNMMLVESNPGRVAEVAPDGRTVWEWVHEAHGESKVPFVTKATRVDLTREEVASWPCSSVDSVNTSNQNE